MKLEMTAYEPKKSMSNPRGVFCMLLFGSYSAISIIIPLLLIISFWIL